MCFLGGGMNRLIRTVSGMLIGLSLTGCSDGYVQFPVTPEAQAQSRPDVDVVQLTTANIASFGTSQRGAVRSPVPFDQQLGYTLGAGDIVNVIVFDHPELTLPAGPERSAEESGFQVQADGTFFYPFIGQIRASGRTAEQIRTDITERLAAFIPEPNIEVRVAAFNSQSVVVSGEVGSPSRQAIRNVPTTLLDSINAAGGANADADLRAISLQRRSGSYIVDLRGFLENGFRENNPVLRDGDVVFVPRRKPEEAYFLGEVTRPDVIDLSAGPVTLTQAVARQGGIREVRADARGIFVFRRIEDRTTVFQLDVSSPEGLLLGARFLLEPSDVIYVVRSPLQRWNDTISRLLPSVSAINALDTSSDVFVSN
jgi:polysaccharide biosynthesis/export protein